MSLTSAMQGKACVPLRFTRHGYTFPVLVLVLFSSLWSSMRFPADFAYHMWGIYELEVTFPITKILLTLFARGGLVGASDHDR